ncbi:MAG: hypothetical protein AABY10_02740 [Nanoarchaeota archaeon]
MKCIFCRRETIVVDSRNDFDFVVRRRRQCIKCKERFTTSETPIKEIKTESREQDKKEKKRYLSRDKRDGGDDA